MLTLVLLALLAAAATGWVLLPVFSGVSAPPVGSAEAGPSGRGAREALRLRERRDQLLQAIAELDFEKDAGKISAAEHGSTRTALLREAASVVARLDELTPPDPPAGKVRGTGS